MARIQIIDVSLRDGNQSLWGASGLNTAKILSIAPVMDRVGFRALCYTSSTHMGMLVRNFRENPWECIRLTHAAMPNTPLQVIGTGLRFISWESQSPEFMQLVYERMVVNGIARFIVLDPMNDPVAMLESARMMRAAGASEIIAALTYTISAVHDDAYYADLASKMVASANVDRVYIKDPAGILTPDRALTLVPAVRARLAGKGLEIHSHCNIGLAPMTCTLAAGLGVEVIHVASGALGNGTSLPRALPMVNNLRELGHTVDVDDHTLRLVDAYFMAIARAEGLPVGTPQEFDATFMRHQAAGGYISTTRRQLAELKLEHRFDEVMEESLRVRADLGYPIMVTPFPQMVGTQALYNVIGSARYGNVSDQVIRYVLGRFGRPTGTIDPEVKDRILSLPRARELAGEPPPPSLAEMRKRFAPGIGDDEFLLRATMPAEQVDAMLAAGPARRHYNPDVQPILALLRGLEGRPVTDLVVEKQDFRLALHTTAGAGQGHG
ncbi:MAG: biotin carboxyl carrier protein [Gammaproteobacteria bacterium]|nr:biotin carboxyl carrier protein [Gammaproteobacteria bacterium]